MKIKYILIVLFVFLLLPSITQASLDPNFNPNRIIEDEDLLDYDSMNLPDIQNFLQNKRSYLAYYYTPDTYGMRKTAAEIIYNATHNNYNCDGVTLSDKPTEAEKRLKCTHITTISPKFLLVLLQKEASLIENQKPQQKHLDWATGYGCPDNQFCNSRYKGFGKQVNSASLQFLAYMKEPYNYHYQTNHAYTFNNPYGTISNKKITVTPQNQATTALYNYTPHVFNGNYNVYKLWNKYFKGSSNINNLHLRYPDGSILKAKNSPVVWLIKEGKKRPFLNWSSFISRFRPEQIISVDSKELEGYPEANAIKFPNYSLLKTSAGKIYLIVDNEKRPFINQKTFQQIGFNPEELEIAKESDLDSYKLGKTITIESTHLTGDLIQVKGGGVYYVENNTKAPLIDGVFLKTKFKGKPVLQDRNNELSKYTKVDPVKFDDGELLKKSSWPTIYLISNGKKRAFASTEVFTNLGYKLENVIEVSPKVLSLYDNGEIIN